MVLQPKSIAEHIECLARLTGAPEVFVSQVKDLFSKKGIKLEEDATPYLKALDEAFMREEVIRTRAAAARRKIEQLRTNFRRIEKTYNDQLERLRRLQTKLRGQGKLTLVHRTDKTGKPVEVSVPGDHRTFVTRTQRETWPLVPGPEEIQ